MYFTCRVSSDLTRYFYSTVLHVVAIYGIFTISGVFILYCQGKVPVFALVLFIDNEEMLHYFYQILIESVLQESVGKEDIANIESIRQKYGIPLADHLSILSNVDDGLTQYTKYLEEFDIIDVFSLYRLLSSLVKSK